MLRRNPTRTPARIAACTAARFEEEPVPPRPHPTRRSVLTAAAATTASAAAVPLLSSCGASSKDGPLTFWNFYSPAPQQDPNLVAQSDWFQQAIDRWNGAGEHEITSVYMTSDQMNQRMPVAFASGDGPDIFLISPGDYLRYANGGVLVDLAPFMTKEAIEDFYPDALTTRREGEKIFGLPMEQEPVALFYDPDLLEKHGVAEGDLPADWDELLELSAKISSGTTTGLVLDVDPGYYQNFTFYPWVWQTGGDVVDPKSQRPVFDDAGPRAALDLWGRAVSSGATPRTRPANGDIVSAFSSGYAAFWETGVWDVMNLQDNAPDKHFGVMPLPAPEGRESSTILGGWAWCVNARGKDPEAAARFVVQSLGSMDRECIDHCARWNGPAKGNMPARRSVDTKMQADGSYDEEHQKIFHDQILPTGRGEPRFPPVVYKAVSDALQSVELAGGDPAEEAGRAQQTIESYLETYEGGTLV
jgi:multiple sugar transport system substrate-binding protein